MTAQVMTTPDELRAALIRLTLELATSFLSPSIRSRAARAVGAVTGTAWPHDVDERLIGMLQEQLFIVTHRASIGAGPLRQVAHDIRTLTEALIPAPPPPDPPECNFGGEASGGNSGGGCSPVLTPGEAARYLGLDRLGVADPAARVRYLVKKRRLRSIKVLGRIAFQRSDLDEYLVRHAAKEGR